jgi:hypothetical protein
LLTRQIVVGRVDELPGALEAMPIDAADLVLAFGAVPWFATPALSAALRRRFPDAAIAGCSTAGEIAVDRVYDGSCVLTAVRLQRSSVRQVETPIRGMDDSFAAGRRLGRVLPAQGLAGAFVLGTGVDINGSALVDGLQSVLGREIPLSGGLAADAGAFRRTWTLGVGGAADDQVVALGFYGDRFRMGSGSFGGWAPFGPARKVTRCQDNVLFELDGERALDIYKRYLGDHARDLPASGLLFPFEMLGADLRSSGLIRSILGVNEAAGSLTLAGAIDPAGYLRLMQASTDRLIEGAATAAGRVRAGAGPAGGRALVILVSCVGRKLVMGGRVDEEVEAVAQTLGGDTEVTGFYSNGEISSSEFHGDCRLHNQTMTITWLSEA